MKKSSILLLITSIFLSTTASADFLRKAKKLPIAPQKLIDRFNSGNPYDDIIGKRTRHRCEAYNAYKKPKYTPSTYARNLFRQFPAVDFPKKNYNINITINEFHIRVNTGRKTLIKNYMFDSKNELSGQEVLPNHEVKIDGYKHRFQLTPVYFEVIRKEQNSKNIIIERSVSYGHYSVGGGRLFSALIYGTSDSTRSKFIKLNANREAIVVSYSYCKNY